MAFLELERVTKRFGEQVAVDAISLDVERGELVSLLGPSGCGKTTTLQMIAGFVDLSGGSIRLEGRDLAAVKPAERGLGIVFQSYALFPHMTAAENVAFGLEMQRVPRDERRVRVAEALQLVGLAGLADRYPRRMSGGQQQRVALARALVIKPRILLLDEPLSNLDAKLREEMQIELRQIQRTVGTTTILVTHDQAEAMALSDRIVVMNKGRVEQIATPQEAYERPASEFVGGFLGKTNILEAVAEPGEGGTRVRLGPESWVIARPLADFGVGRRVRITIRPERIELRPAGSPGLPARLDWRIFQGSHWLMQVGLEAGPKLIVVRPNAGGDMPAEGAPVAVAWGSEDMRVAPVEGRPA